MESEIKNGELKLNSYRMNWEYSVTWAGQIFRYCTKISLTALNYIN